MAFYLYNNIGEQKQTDSVVDSGLIFYNTEAVLLPPYEPIAPDNVSFNLFGAVPRLHTAIEIENPRGPGSIPGIFYTFSKVFVHNQAISIPELLANEVFYVELMNTHERNLTISSVLVSSSAIIVESPSQQDIIKAKNSIIVQLKVSPNPPPDIVVRISFIFTDGTTSYLDIQSYVAPLFLIHQPSGILKETIAYKTDVMTTFNGKEQRVCLRLTPRITYNTQFEHLNSNKGKFLTNLLSRRHAITTYFPLSQYIQISYSNLILHQTEIYVDTSFTSFTVGGFVCMWTGVDAVEIKKIKEVHADRLIFENPVFRQITGPLYVAPMDEVYLSSKIRYNFDNNMKVKSEVLLEGILAFSHGAYPFQANYNGKPVLIEPNLFENTQGLVEIETGIKRVDVDIGVFAFENNWTVPKQMYRLGRYFADKEKAYLFKSFLEYLQGRLKPIYIPTLLDDFVLVSGALSTHNYIQVDNQNFGALFGYREGDTPDTIMRHIALFDGTTWVFKEIDYVEVINEQTEIIYLTSTVDITLVVGNCKICMMPLCRQAKDSVEIEWVRSGEGYCVVDFLAVEE